jgi:dolichyl-phosphate-mannose--protein O-mannosyl transferase
VNFNSIEPATSFLAPVFHNNSCTPYQAAKKPCLLGNLPAYVISASSAQDIVAGVKFAQANNIWLVVKNIGLE